MSDLEVNARTELPPVPQNGTKMPPNLPPAPVATSTAAAIKEKIMVNTANNANIKPAPEVSKLSFSLPEGMDPAYYALSLLKRRQLEKCVEVSSYYLNQNMKRGVTTVSGETGGKGNIDELLWVIQTKSMVQQSWYEDAELEEDGVDEVLLDGEEAVGSNMHQPNKSIQTGKDVGRNTTAGRLTAVQRGGSRAGAIGTGRAGIGTSGGRPISSRFGFARPGSIGNRPGSVAGQRGGTAGARPITGRFVRLGTASLMSVPGGPYIDVQKLNMEKIARERPMTAKLLCDYLIYVEHRPKLALDLCQAALKVTSSNSGASQATANNGLPLVPRNQNSALPPMGAPGATESKTQLQVGIPNQDDWWWKARLGKANYQLGLLREAEKYFKAALFDKPSRGDSGTQDASNRFSHYDTTVIMELAKVYMKMDQPLTAMELYMEALEVNVIDHLMVLCSARLNDELHDPFKAFDLYKQVLLLDSSNIEAIACTAAFFFYEKNQPELALRFYRRLLQMGVHTCEVWNNIGLCGYYTSQFDFALRCMEKALTLCTEPAIKADVWFNIGHVAIGLGDLVFARRAFQLAVATDATHGEALNNMAVLSLTAGPHNAGSKPSSADASTGANNDKNVVNEEEGNFLLHVALQAAPELLETLYNQAVQSYKSGDLEQSYNMVTRALDVVPGHAESILLHDKIVKHFTSL